jgi:Zn-dependent peptidase ImmA (M78 family)
MPAQKVELPEKWVTPEMIRWTREQVGLDVEQAAGLVKDLSAEKIHAWEAGEESPTLQDLESLAEIYDCPVGYFFLESAPPQEAPRLDYRGMSPEKLRHLSYESRRRLRQFIRLVDFASSLISLLGLDWKVSVSTESLEKPAGEIAARVVKHLDVTAEALSELSTDEEAFNLWRTKIEEQGVLVFSLRLDPGELRGASLWDYPKPPAILVNHADVESASGRTFTLLHEYAHLLVKQPGIVCDFRGHLDIGRVERFANQFAAEALVPRALFEDLLNREGLNSYREQWGNTVVDKLRKPFHSSHDVIRVLLEELSYAPEGSYREWRSSRDKDKPWGRGRSGGQSKAVRRRREFGTNFSRLLAHANQRSIVSKLDLADILDMKVEQAETFLESFR